MKPVLAISWEMPPMYGPRAAQVSRVLAELPAFGWTPTVVCMDPRPHGPHWFDGAATVPTGVRIVRVPSPQESMVYRAMFRLIPALRDYPDAARPWIAPALSAARAAATSEQHAALISFAQPWSDHLVGLRVHRAMRLPWVAHFSDPWSDSPYATARQRRIWARMEADVIREATAVVFVTQEAADLVMKKYPDSWRAKVAVVPHGFKARVAASAHRADCSRPMRMVYTGRFYRDVRTPVALLRALAQLNRRQTLAGSIAVSFVGPRVGDYQSDAEQLGVASLVSFQDRASSATVEAMAADADVLLVIDAASDGPSVFLPSKLVDYLAFRKTVFGITPDEGATASLLRRLAFPFAPQGDVEAIAAAIEGLLTRWRAGKLCLDSTFDAVAAEYEITHTARRLVDVLASACA